MSYTGSAPARQPAPIPPGHDLPLTIRSEETLQRSGYSVAYVRLLWGSRRALVRITLFGLLTSELLAFLIPVRFESTARLMPPDSSQSSGLAMAAAAMSGGTGGWVASLATCLASRVQATCLWAS